VNFFEIEALQHGAGTLPFVGRAGVGTSKVEAADAENDTDKAVR